MERRPPNLETGKQRGDPPGGTRVRPLLIAPFGELGGSEIVLLRLAERLVGRCEPRAIVMTPGPLAGLLRELGVPTEVKRLPGRRAVARFPFAARSIARDLRNENITIIHANGIKAALLGSLLSRRLGIPLVWMKHDHAFEGWPSRFVAARCDRIVCVTRGIADEFPSRLQPKLMVINPGVADKAAGPADDTKPLIVAAGRLDPDKGFADLLRAVAVLRDRGVEARAIIAGGPDRVFPHHRDELLELIDRLGLKDLAELPGWVDDLSPFYAQARVIALATKPRRDGRPGEAMPLTLLEGMAAGRPVVGPREPGVVEAVGDAGTLVDDTSPAALAGALEPYLRDPQLAATTGELGRRRFVQHFTVDRMVERLVDVYTDLDG